MPKTTLRTAFCFIVASLLLVSTSTFPSTVSAQGSGATADWYEANRLLGSLRPQARDELPGAAGVERLEDLTLYDLELSLDVEHRTFELTEEVFFTNTYGRPLREVVLRVYGNTVPGPAPVRVQSGECVGTTCEFEEESTTTIVFRPERALHPGERLRMRIQIEGRLRLIEASESDPLSQGLEGLTSMMGGEGGGDYGLLAVGDGIASMANFYAMIARRPGGRWERETESTMGDLGSDAMGHVCARIRVDAGVKVVSSGVTFRVARDGNKRVHHVAAAMVREFSMLASEDFETASRSVGDIMVRSHFLPRDREAGMRVLDVAAEAMAIFERRFGGYPYADFDVVEATIVGGAGGVEFAGLVTVASMNYRPMSGGQLGMLAGLLGQGGGGNGAGGGGMADMQRSMLEFTTAHEVAHQYWHGLVGSDSRDHPFADESLAQFSTLLYLRDRYGEERARADGDRMVRMSYQMMRLMGKPDGAVDRPVEDFGSSIEYAGLVYGKGPYLFVRLRELLGDRAFFRGVRRYIARYRYRMAPPRGLIDVLARGRARRRVRALARRWLDQARGDNDLGRADMGSLMSTMMGGAPGAGGAGGPDLGRLFEMLGGQGGGGLGGGGQNGQPGGPDLQRMLQQLMQGQQRGLGQ